MREGSSTDRGASGVSLDVIARAQGGDQEAFRAIVEEYAGRVRHVLMRRGAGLDQTEDLIQETFLRAWRGLPAYEARKDSCLVSWLFAIAVRVHATQARRPVVNGEVQGLHKAVQSCHVAEERDHKDHADLWTLADAILPPHARTALWLAYAEDLTPTQIAFVLGCTAVNVRVTLLRARVRLRTAIADAGIDIGGVRSTPKPRRATHANAPA